MTVLGTVGRARDDTQLSVSLFESKDDNGVFVRVFQIDALSSFRGDDMDDMEVSAYFSEYQVRKLIRILQKGLKPKV